MCCDDRYSGRPRGRGRGAHLDDGVEELLGLAARLEDVRSVGARIVVGVVRALAVVPLRVREAKGQGSGISAGGRPEAGRGEGVRARDRETRTCAA